MVCRNIKITDGAVLTIAGSDPLGGAGIQADLLVFSFFGLNSFSAITALTVQTKKGVASVHPIPADVLTQQLSAVSRDCCINAVKIGMIGTAANVLAIELFLRSTKVQHVIIDPVFRSSNGVALLETRAINLFKKMLLPHATLITPNLDEASVLAGLPISDTCQMKSAGKTIFAAITNYGSKNAPANVLIKGGHLTGAPVDILFDGKTFTEFAGRRLTNKDIHGTGCVLSSAITAHLALGNNMIDSVRLGRKYLQKHIVKEALKNSRYHGNSSR